MSDTTHAFLPARKVSAACYATLREIERDRKNIALDVAREIRRMRPWLWFRPLSWVAKAMPDYLHAIVREHRALEEATITAVRDLANAAAAQGDAFTVYISATDFAHIRAHYQL